MKKIILAGVSTCLLAASMSVSANENELSDDSVGVSASFSPLLGLLGFVRGDVSYDINNNFTVGPTFAIGKTPEWLSTDQLSLFSLGARGEYALNGVDSSGMYGALESNYNINSVQRSGAKCSFSNIQVNAMAGYGVRSNKGFFMRLGGGLATGLPTIGDTMTCADGATRSLPSIVEHGLTSSFALEISMGLKI